MKIKIKATKIDFKKIQKDITNEAIKQETERIKRKQRIEQSRKHLRVEREDYEFPYRLKEHSEDEAREMMWKRTKKENTKQPVLFRLWRGEDNENS